MNVGDFLEVIVEWTLPSGSNPAVNVWDFRCELATDPTELQTVGSYIASAFVSRYVVPLLPIQSNQIYISALRLRNLNDASEGYDNLGNIAAGGSNSPMLPPFVTYSVQEQRTSFALRNGRKGLPGPVVASMNNNGTLSATYIAAFDTAFNGWETTEFIVEAGDSEYAFIPAIVRKPSVAGTPPTVYTPIRGYSISKYGSQNSRK